MRKSMLQADTDHENTIYSIRMHQKLPFFIKKNGQKWPFFWSKIDFFGFSQAVEEPPPIVRVLDAKKHVVGRHRSRKHNIQHPYAPKFAMFHAKTAKHGRFLVKN